LKLFGLHGSKVFGPRRLQAQGVKSNVSWVVRISQCEESSSP
jgi:hypothetical protein